MPALLIAGAWMLPQAVPADEEADVSHYSDSSNDRTPATTSFPAYPSIARRERIEGEATVCFRIDRRGRVIRPSIRSSTHEIFERPAMRAIKRSSFEPLPRGEKPSPVKTCRTYRFRLEPLTAQN